MTGSVRDHRRPSDDERAFFEALVTLRQRYTLRDPGDVTSVMNLRHAIAAANVAMGHSSKEVRRSLAAN